MPPRDADGSGDPGSVARRPASQTSPEITALANGGFVVTWVDLSQGVGGGRGYRRLCREGAGVRGRRDAGGAEILVNSATVSQQARARDTALVERWLRGDVAGSPAKVSAARAGMAERRCREGAGAFAAGTPVGTEILVNSATVSSQYCSRSRHCRTAACRRGRISAKASAVGGDSSGSAVKAQVSRPANAGRSRDPRQQRHPERPGRGRSPRSRMAASVTWQDQSQGTGGRRRHQQLRREGAGVRGPARNAGRN